MEKGPCHAASLPYVRVILAFLIAAAACHHDTSALAAEPAAKTFELAIPQEADRVAARVLRVKKDDLVRLRITSETAGEIHLHAYRLDVKVTPGSLAELSFKARATGRFRIEWHPESVPAKKGYQHAPPLATLEVRPR